MIPFTVEVVLNVFALCVIAMGLGYLWGWINGAQIKKMDDKEIAALRRYPRGK
jgi:F420-0:gamma-glutamyl ligase-like protein